MFKVGITGGIGSGKSVICNIFRNLDIPVYQADIEARRMMGEDETIRGELLAFFGTEAFQNNQLNRKFLSERIFPDPKARSFVNSLVHPAVRSDFAGWVEKQASAPYIIEEAALLFETGAWKELDYNILIVSAVETRIGRIMERDEMTRAEVLARMDSQMDPEKAVALADFVISNDEEEFVIPQVLKVDKIIRDLALEKS